MGKENGNTEESWASDRVEKMRKAFFPKRSINLQTVFIDSHYNSDLDDSSLDFQTEKFKNYTKILWKFADTVQPFDMIDIKIARPKIFELTKAKEALEQNYSRVEENLKDLEKKNNDLIYQNSQKKICDTKHGQCLANLTACQTSG